MHNYSLDITELSRRITPKQSQQLPHSSPISLLIPPEILTQIFLYCIPSEQFPIPSHNEAPLLLTRVSSYWRTLAINTPDLWSAFHINYKDPAEDIPATNLWLKRSTNRPLSLSLAIDFGEQSQQAILDALCRHSNRWKHVRFDFRHLYCPPMYSLDIAEDSIPQLTTFEFHARDISSTNLSPIIRLLKTAPRLQEVTWVDDLADTDMLLELPLNQLTRLSLAMDHGTLDYIQILNRCSNLQHIRITRPLRIHQPKPSPLFLDKLTSLTISYDLTAVLDYLVLPALKHVRIFTANHGSDKRGEPPYPTTKSYSYESLLHHSHYLHLQPRVSHSGNRAEVWDPSPLISLIDRSTCDISTLSLCAPMMENALLLCLSKISADLVSLELEGVEVGDKVLNYLTRRRHRRRSRRPSRIDDRGRVGIESESGELEDSENEEYDGVDEDILCPNLEHLILHTQIISSQGVLADMIASRLRHIDSKTSMDPSSNPDGPRDGYITGFPTLKKLVIVDGHWDLDRVKEFSSLSQSTDGFKVYIIPRKPIVKGRIRNYFFRRKLCSSR
jgi:F-box-like